MMQELTKKTIQKLQKSTDHVLAVEDFDDIEALDKLALKMGGVSRTERRLLNAPFDLYGIKFYPLTVAKSLWYIEKLEEWDVPEIYHDGFFFWMLTLPLTSEALDENSEFNTASERMTELSKRLHCTTEEIIDICNKCCGRSGGSSGDGEGEEGQSMESQFGSLVASIVREYGGTPDYWLHEAPLEKVSEFYEQLIARLVAEDNASRASSSKGGKATAPAITPKIRAFKEFRDKEQAIREKWSVENGE